MRRFGFFNPDPSFALAMASTFLMAAQRAKRAAPRVPSDAVMAELYDQAKREDWNRAVEARKAAKKARKP